MQLLKRILGLVFVKRKETSNKWWHRLFLVLLVGSSVLLFIGICITQWLGSNDRYNWVTHEPTKFVLESGYEEAKGKEIPCRRVVDNSLDSLVNFTFIIECPGVYINHGTAVQYEKLYESAQKTASQKYDLDKYVNSCGSFPAKNVGIDEKDNYFSCFRDALNKEQADPAYQKYLIEIKNFLKIKVVEQVHFGHILIEIFKCVFVSLLLTAVWVVLWGGIVYRSILYIIFGKNSEKS